MRFTDRQLPRRHLASVPGFAQYDADKSALSETDQRTEFAKFIRLSVEMTGFSEAELAATGMGHQYFDEFGTILGIPVRTRLLSNGLGPADRMEDDFLGPLVRNVIRMWYLGQWKQLEKSWIALLTEIERKAFDEFQLNVNRVISAQAYEEGLAWVAIGTHPSGAKQPGFASWSRKP
jgi:hypothetical protein